MTKCTLDEFNAFVKAYPRKLVRDVNGTCEPPYVTYNDFTLGDWPKSIVAGYDADPDETERTYRTTRP